MRKTALLLALLFATPSFAQTATRGVVGNVQSCSGTVTTGGTSQQVLPANPQRYYLFIQNPIAASEPLQVNFGSAASNTADSFELAAGGSLTFAGNFIPGGTVNVNAVTTAHRFICKSAG